MGRLSPGHAVLAAYRRLRRFAGFAPLPWGIDLLLTDACNLCCSYCPFTAELAGRPARIMADTGKAIRFLESVARFRPMIRLIGGEPFLHPGWPEIVAAAVERSVPTTVVTNGSMLAGRAEELVRAGFLAIGISVDPPEAHDVHRGQGTFAQCESVVEEIVRARKKRGAATPLIEIYTTVHAGTWSHLTRWAERLAGWGIDTLRLQHEIWLPAAARSESDEILRKGIGHASFFRGEVDAYCRDIPPDVDGRLLEDQLRRLASMTHPFRLELQPPLPPDEIVKLYCDPDFRRSGARVCTLTSSYTFVDPTGRLYPCLSLDMGNVFDQPFEKVWNGARYRAFRRLLRREQRLPICEHCTA